MDGRGSNTRRVEGKNIHGYRRKGMGEIDGGQKGGTYSETLNNEYIERIYQMSYSSLSDNGMLQIYSFLIK